MVFGHEVTHGLRKQSEEAYQWLSRKSVGIKLEVEGKMNFVLWLKNISKQ